MHFIKAKRKVDKILRDNWMWFWCLNKFKNLNNIYYSSRWQAKTKRSLVVPKRIHFQNNKPERTVNTRITLLCLAQDTIAPLLQINTCVQLYNRLCITYSYLHGTLLNWALKEDLTVLWQSLQCHFWNTLCKHTYAQCETVY